MGADLYIRPVFDPVHEKYEKKFEKYVAKRDKAESPKQVARYQERVAEYYDKMYSAGYYRDSYNDTNLLWKLGLDYWVWLAGHLDKEGQLSPEKAELVLAELESRKHMLSEIEEGEDREYFEEKYQELITFLSSAIEMDAPIVCSI